MTTSSVQASLAEKAAVLKGKQPAKKRKSTWHQPTLEDLAEGTVLAFDQTFSKTGFAVVKRGLFGLTVLAHGFLNEPPIPDSPRFWDILQRTEWMGERMGGVVRDTRSMLGPGQGFEVVHEAPILHGMRVESSLLGAVKVWEACKANGLPQPTIVENRHMLNTLCPPTDRSGKPAIKRAVNQFHDTNKGWNEHNRDALALALTHLIFKKRATS